MMMLYNDSYCFTESEYHATYCVLELDLIKSSSESSTSELMRMADRLIVYHPVLYDTEL